MKTRKPSNGSRNNRIVLTHHSPAGVVVNKQWKADCRNVGPKRIVLDARRLVCEQGKSLRVLLALEEITDAPKRK